MNTSMRYLRLYLHCPTRGKRAIGYLSQYGVVALAQGAAKGMPQ
jgi:hypothetical protein